MKVATFLFALTISLFSFSQTQSDLVGKWFAPDANAETPLGFDFLANGELKVYEVNLEANDAYSVINGHYYYEEGSDLLVTITWYGDGAKTTSYKFSFDSMGKLTLTETYPQDQTVSYEREGNIADL